MDGIPLIGLNGANPLAFLAALGTIRTASFVNGDAKLAWRLDQGAWRPIVFDCGNDEDRFIDDILRELRNASMEPFEADTKLPFSAERFARSVRAIQNDYSEKKRRIADLWSALGTEAFAEDGLFQDTAFRMVRSGDSAGNGLPAYALNVHTSLTREALVRTLLRPWDYQDDSRGSSFRWDPVDDQRYALRWKNPSKSGPSDGPGTMIGANRLALEGLCFFPTFCVETAAVTTGFCTDERRNVWFLWPIWCTPLSLDSIRGLLALAEIRRRDFDRGRLVKRGIGEVFKSQRIAQNQYYSNFTWGTAA